MNRNGNTIECICRKYRVQAKGGMIVEVESTKPLSKKLTNELLQEDDDINLFFSNHKIINVGQMATKPTENLQEIKVESKLTSDKIIFTPMQRLNSMLKMKGEFTRDDYQKHMFEKYRVIVEKFKAHYDIRDALSYNRLEIAEGKDGRAKKYRVLDPTEIDEDTYKSLMRDHRMQLKIVQ